MDIKDYVIVLLLLGFTKLQVSLCEQIEANFTCSPSSSTCNADGHISKLSDGLRIDTSVSCGTCRLVLNTTIGSQIHFEIGSSSPWLQLHHLYFIYDNVISGFTEKVGQCGITFPTHIVEVNYKLDGAFTISTRETDQTEQCSPVDGMTCDLKHTCENLLNFNNVKKVKFEERESSLESNFLHPTVNQFYGDFEIGGDPPQCPTKCTCSLHFHKFVTNCGSYTRHTLLLYPQLTGLNPLTVIISGGLSNHDLVTAFDASRNQLQSIDTDSFQDLNYINRISLNHNLLTYISPGTFGWNELALLSIADNKLTTLDPNIFKDLTFLLLLDLHGNQLTSLHPNLFRSNRFILAADLSRNNLQEILPETLDPISQIGTLILNHNNITSLQKDTFRSTNILQWLYMNDNQLETIEPGTFNSLRQMFRLHLSGNRFSVITTEMFQGAETLKELILSRNNIKTLPPNIFSIFTSVLSIQLDYNKIDNIDLRPFTGLQQLLALNLTGNHLTYFDYGLDNNYLNKTELLPRLKLLLLNDNQLQNLNGDIFEEMPDIGSIQIRGNPLKRVDTETFRKVQNNDTNILVDEPATCCFIENNKCLAQNRREPYLTCLRLLPYPSVRVIMWLLGLFAFVGNLSVLLWRCIKHGKEKVVQRLLIENLAASDLLMGVYMLIIASSDAYYHQYFPSESNSWRNGPWCKVAGTLSVLSSEGSVFFITLISIDRFLAIKYPRGKWRLTKKSLTITLIALWSLALLLSIIPTSVSGKNPNFYDVSEVCIGLPFVRAPVFFNRSVIVADFQFEADDLYSLLSSTRDDVYYEQYIYPETGENPGLYFSIVLFLGINMFCFIIVALCYISIFIIVKQISKNVGKSRRDQEITLAIRMGAIVLTDFMCWVPIVVIGILVQSNVVTISPVVYVYIVVFILPINSTVNPYIYTIAIVLSDYRARNKARRERNKKSKARDMAVSTTSTNDHKSRFISLSNQDTTSSNI